MWDRERRNREGYKGINELNKMAKLHDQFCNENPDSKTRNISYIASAHRANKIANDPTTDDLKEETREINKNVNGKQSEIRNGIVKKLEEAS